MNNGNDGPPETHAAVRLKKSLVCGGVFKHDTVFRHHKSHIVMPGTFPGMIMMDTN